MIRCCLLISLLAPLCWAAGPETVGPWRLELVAQAPAVRHPSVVCETPDGRILVAEDPMDISVPADARQGRIICFHPDGRRTVFAENLHAVFGLQYLEGKVFVLHNPKFAVFKDEGDRGEWLENLIESTNPNPWALDWNDHVPANFKLAADGHFYMAVGDKGIYGAQGKDGHKVYLHGGGILRIRPDGSGMEVFATGVRNILDVALTSEDEVFTYDNTDEHNWMGRLTHIVEGGFYGYPHDFVPRRPYTLWMMHDFGGGAATGTFAYTEDALPAEFRDNLFLADFGKRQILRVVIERAGATFKVTRHEELFANMPDDFRPVGIAPSADGKSILICDWQHRDTKEAVEVGRLWRLTYTGKTEAQERPGWYLPLALGERAAVSNDELARGLAHPGKSVRLAAARELQRRNVPVEWPEDDVVRLRRLLRSSALNAEKLLWHKDASIRFHAATAIGREGRRAGPMIARLSEKEPFARYAVEHGLNRMGRRDPLLWREIVPALRVHTNAAFALRETWDTTLLGELERFVFEERHPTRGRISALKVVAAMARKYPEWKGEWWAYHPALAPAPTKTKVWEGTEKSLGIVAKAAGVADAEVRLAAYESIGELKERSLAPLLRKRFEAENTPRAHRALLRAMAALRDEAAGALVARVLRQELSELTMEAVRAAEFCSKNGAREALLELLQRENLPGELRAEVIRTAGELGIGREWIIKETASSDGRVRAAAIKAMVKKAEKAEITALFAVLHRQDKKSRLEAIEALGKIKHPDSIPELLSAWREPATREVAQDALLGFSDIRALEVYEDSLGSANPAVRERARKALEPIKDDAWPALKEGVANMKPVVVAQLRTIYGDRPDLTLVTKQQVVPTTADYIQFALANQGNAGRGKTIFFDEAGVSCAKCHVVGSQGTAVGPDLTNIGAQFPRDALIEHIVTPSKSVREGYQQVRIEMDNDESLSGLIKSESAEELTILDGQAKLRTIPKRKIIARRSSDLSLMPEGLHVGLSLEQFADLIAYLESLKEGK